MRVAYLLRSDAATKPGGDSSKVARYISALERRGVDCSVVYSIDALKNLRPDIVHLLNLDLPLENLAYASAAKKYSGKIVLSTIRHPFDGMHKMYHHGDDKYHRSLRLLGLSADQGYLLRERVKLALRRNVASTQRGSSFAGMQARLASTVDLLLPMAPAEKLDLIKDFEPLADPVVVPNGFSFLGNSGRSLQNSKYDLISVGRVEPRKNTLALARAADRAGKKLIVIGGLNRKHTKYISDFLGLVENSSYVTYGGTVNHDQLVQELKKAETYINPAWFEVVSQADCEAAAAGLNVISTRHSYVSDYLEGRALNFDPLRLVQDGATDYLLEAMQKASPARLREQLTWEDTADALCAAYEEVTRA